jgi:hypothetical protein
LQISPLEDSVDKRSFLAVDMASRERMLAIEFHGPFHYNKGGRIPNARTLMKKRLLKKRGWKVLAIPWWEWQVLGTKDDRILYLKKLLGLTV